MFLQYHLLDDLDQTRTLKNDAPATTSHVTNRPDTEENSLAAPPPVISSPIPDSQEDALAAPSLINMLTLTVTVEKILQLTIFDLIIITFFVGQ